MLNKLKTFITQWQGMLIAIGFISLLLATRMAVTGHRQFVFLEWNLFLALVPLGISSYLLQRKQLSKSKLVFFSLLWLLFFPNAPYIITDLMHLGRFYNRIPWFDSILVFSFALTALFAGMISLIQLKSIFERNLSSRYYSFFQFCCFLLTGFGIYLGRFERWNSWDLLTHPRALFFSCMESAVDKKAIAVTLILAGCLFMTYQLLQQTSLLLYDTAKKDNA